MTEIPNQDPNKFRASFSVLKFWATGIPNNQEEAIRMYFKMPIESKPWLEEGKKYHEQWETEIKATSCLPKVFGGNKLTSPRTEQKIVIQVDDWLDLVGVVDLIHEDKEIGGTIIEDFKTGRTPSTSHLSSHQLGIYAALCQNQGMKVKQVRVRHFNQYTQGVDTAYKWVDRPMMESALDWVITWSSDMHNFLNENKVHQDPYKFLGITNTNISI